MPKLRIDVFTHNVKCTQFDNQAKQALLTYTAKVARVDLVPDPDWDPRSGRRRRMVKQIVKIYAALRRDRTEFRFHINQFGELMQSLTASGIWEKDIEIVYRPEPKYVPHNFVLKDKRTPRDYQIEKIEYLKKDQRTKILIAQTGTGKAQPLNAKILTPTGWAVMGDMEIGTEVVTPKGTVTKVTGVFPQGRKEIYRVTFIDGRSTEACGEHLWRIINRRRPIDRRVSVVSTDEVARLLSSTQPRVYVDLITPYGGDDINLPIDPYVLGVILGDGGISQSCIRIHKTDQELFDRVASKLPSSVKLSKVIRKDTDKCLTYSIVSSHHNGNWHNVMIEKLKELGLMGSLAHNKFIPDVYFDGSRLQRLELLRGLLDTDGHSTTMNTVGYTTTSLELALGVQYLVRSLGGLATVRERQTSFTWKGVKKQGRKSYAVNIRHKNSTELFTVERKKENLYEGGRKDNLKLAIAKVEKVRTDYTQCISVEDEDHLYITDDFIPTHNTMMSLRAIQQRNKRTFLALTKKVYMNKWIDDVEDAYDCKKGDIVVIKGTKQLNTLIECAKNDDLDAKFIICSMRTLQMYIDKYEAGEDVVAEYGCNPEELFEILGVGIRFIDEVHEHFHTVFKLDLYTHVSETINLTATLIDDNVFVERMMRVMFPLNERPPKSPYDKYIETIAYGYGLSPEGLKYMRYKQPGRGSYSHVRFEKSLLDNKKYLKRYLGFIQKTAEETFFSVREDKQRLLIFCSTIALCEEVVKYLRQQYPAINTNKYTAEDKYETLLSSDVVVSTLLSAGTAVDVPDLRTAIMTTAIGSRRQNVQALGRLRRMSNYPNTTPTFAYFVCVDIEEHHKYYEKKVEIFEDKTLVHKVEHTSFSL